MDVSGAAPPRQPFAQTPNSTYVQCVRDETDQTAVIAALSDPATWPGRPARVERVDTHAAMLFLAGDAVLKIKRAVRLPYLDFTTLASRELVCRKEFALNAPHAPGLYRGVVAILRRGDGSTCIDDMHAGSAAGDPGEIVDWAVAMRRFAKGVLLSEMAASGTLTPTILKRLADRIVAFHETAPRAVPAHDGAPDVVASVTAAVGVCTDPALTRAATTVSRLMGDALARSTQVRVERARQGKVRRCHGDLHLRNIVLWEGEPVPFDALEFDEALATIDTLYDLAFLLMDVDRKATRADANLLLNRYLWRTGDALDLAGLAALPLFLGLRASIRAMVTLDRAAQAIGDVAPELAHAVEALERAAAYLQPPHARLVAIGGLSGTGKSTLAADIAPSIGAAPGALHVRTDLERKWLAGVGEFDRLPERAYAPDMSRETYARVLTRAETALRAGHSVIVDGVFSSANARVEMADLARRTGVVFHGMWLTAAPELLQARVAQRTGDASDATPEILARQLAAATAVDDWPHLDAGDPPVQVAERARRLLLSDR